MARPRLRRQVHAVCPNLVILPEESGVLPQDIQRQENRLLMEGQIEPLVAHRDVPGGNWVVDNSDWPYASAQVIAARRLHWPTILIAGR